MDLSVWHVRLMEGVGLVYEYVGGAQVLEIQRVNLRQSDSFEQNEEDGGHIGAKSPQVS